RDALDGGEGLRVDRDACRLFRTTPEEDRLMFRKLLAFALLLPTLVSPAYAAGDLSDEDVFALVGEKKTCSDGGFTDIFTREIGIPIVTLDPNKLYEYCFK